MLRDDMMRNWRLAGSVERYHSWPTIQRQTVADHSWQVMRVYIALFGEPEQEIYSTILRHDITEMWTGDIPYPAKSRYILLKQAVDGVEQIADKEMGVEWPTLVDRQRSQIKICDLVEMWEFGMMELRLGNSLAQPIVDSCKRAAGELAETIGEDSLVRAYMEKFL